jgi:signal peptidase I
MMERNRYKLGNVFDGLDQTRRKDMVHRHVDDKETCRNCGVRYLCGGPVPDDTRGAPRECEINRELAECAMTTYYRMCLKKKTWVINTDKWMKSIMPHRWDTTNRSQPDKKTRQLTVKGSSMRPFLNDGDRVVVRPFDVEKMKIGDIVCFGKPVTCHRVIRKSRENGRLVVLEKGDRRLTGTRIPANEISGKVVTIHKANRTLTLDTKRRRLLNRFIAVISLLAHTAGKAFAKGKKGR